MDLRFSAADLAFAAEVRAWLAGHLTGRFAVLAGKGGSQNEEFYELRTEWERELHAGGWTGLGWPAEYGGRPATVTQRVLFEYEYARACAPYRAGFQGTNLLGPTLIAHGTHEQKRRFLPGILAGEEVWCQGFSEPGAGSDLAGVKTRAALERGGGEAGGEWVIDGQKIWTSHAHQADWIYVLARTDPAASRHRGLSVLLVPMRQPGIEVRPIMNLAGGDEFNEVFFTGARTGSSLVVGALNEGWPVAMSTLEQERGIAMLGYQTQFEAEFAAVLRAAHDTGATRDPLVRDRLARSLSELKVMGWDTLRMLTKLMRNGSLGAETSLLKLAWPQWHQRLGELEMDLLGAASQVVGENYELSPFQRTYLVSRAESVYGGAQQVHLNIVAERLLGLPRDPRPAEIITKLLYFLSTCCLSRRPATRECMRVGPLDGVRVIELAGMGPGPFAAMMLADMGADVIRVDRYTPGGELPDTERRVRAQDPSRYVMHRGRRSIAVDLKHPAATELLLRMAERSEALIEGFRPGVAERLGLSPRECLRRNPRLVYGRMTGWGQDGPLAASAGHDINYIALSGALANFAREGQLPVPPVNLVGDMGGGGLMLAFGLVCALLQARVSGHGQVVDASIVDGSAALTVMLYGLRAQGRWPGAPGANFCDTGAPYYDVYETADGRHIAVGAIEPRFYGALLAGLGLPPEDEREQNDATTWPAKRRRFAAVFGTRTRDEWAALFAGTDACVTPVLSLDEAADHPHNKARSTFTEFGGITQPSPAPRFSRTPAGLTRRPPLPGEHTDDVLAGLGFTPEEVTDYRDASVIG